MLEASPVPLLSDDLCSLDELDKLDSSVLRPVEISLTSLHMSGTDGRQLFVDAIESFEVSSGHRELHVDLESNSLQEPCCCMLNLASGKFLDDWHYHEASESNICVKLDFR